MPRTEAVGRGRGCYTFYEAEVDGTHFDGNRVQVGAGNMSYQIC